MTHVHYQPDEIAYVFTRKHWFILVRDAFVPALALLAPFVFWGTAGANGASIDQPTLWLFFTAVWLLVWWMVLMTIWTNYSLDQWVVTDRRVVYMEQHYLFYRDNVSLRIERIQDVSVRFRGPIQMLLNFGTLQIQTAGASAEFTEAKGIPDPETVKNEILRQVDRYTEIHVKNFRESDLYYSSDTDMDGV